MGDLGKDLESFLFSCKLTDKRMASIKRNLPASFADGIVYTLCLAINVISLILWCGLYMAGCACAEIIHSVFPKLVDIHNYNEASSVVARTSNWNLLNKKVLKKLNCQLEVRSIDIFVNRRSSDQIVNFLKILRAKLVAYGKAKFLSFLCYVVCLM